MPNDVGGPPRAGAPVVRCVASQSTLDAAVMRPLRRVFVITASRQAAAASTSQYLIVMAFTSKQKKLVCAAHGDRAPPGLATRVPVVDVRSGSLCSSAAIDSRVGKGIGPLPAAGGAPAVSSAGSSAASAACSAAAAPGEMGSLAGKVSRSASSNCASPGGAAVSSAGTCAVGRSCRNRRRSGWRHRRYPVGIERWKGSWQARQNDSSDRPHLGMPHAWQRRRLSPSARTALSKANEHERCAAPCSHHRRRLRRPVVHARAGARAGAHHAGRPTNHHLFQPLLYQVATAGLSAPDIAAPLRHILRQQRNVHGAAGRGDRHRRRREAVQRAGTVAPQTLDYDFLLVASGATHAYFGHDDWAAHAPGLKTLDDALAHPPPHAAGVRAGREPRPATTSATPGCTSPSSAAGPPASSWPARWPRSRATRCAGEFRRIDPRRARCG